MKKTIYFLILSLVVVSGFVFSFSSFASNSEANSEIKKEKKPAKKSLSCSENNSNLDQRKKWEASPDGIKYKEWENSPEGKKIHASYDAIKEDIKTFSEMEGILTSVTFQRPTTDPSSPKWLIVKINDYEYMMQYSPKDFEKFKDLKVNDKIFIRSRSAGFSHNHPYLVLSGDFIEHENKVLFKRKFNKNDGC